MRDRLIELIESARYWGANTSEEIADRLISDGVIVPPCKEGETVYAIAKIECQDCPNIIERDCTFRKCPLGVVEKRFVLSRSMLGKIGKTVFLTREEAEKALAGGANG